ncbi:hypothetical protein H310_09043 [Aphanomyces invadans]|uniref:PB1 domain-containing protein n=1 Tax=Aphanomyces invadans TaxID=157072 RepID=A0A024TW31_9STRA|nr:hypothetical protein H310_09043 [Aphanomyces invadans]ETV98350.1 hypothetical protein H310_09043 [Aphanomyces invadans]|eukprot:XP_008873225.1 hypothetical protein H310_09043 [Aphanomyces invadans]
MPTNNQTTHLGQLPYLHDDLEAGNAEGPHPSTTQEAATAAQDYVNLVRKEIGDQEDVYRQFLDGLQEFLVDIPDKYRRMLDILQGRPHLVAGFNIFLPDLYRNYDLAPEGSHRSAVPHAPAPTAVAPHSTFGAFCAAPPAVMTSPAPPTTTKSLRSSSAPHNITTMTEYMEWLKASKPPSNAYSSAFPSQPSTRGTDAPKARVPLGAFSRQPNCSSRASPKARRQYPLTPTVPRTMPAKLSDFGCFTLPLTPSTTGPSTTGITFPSSSFGNPLVMSPTPSIQAAAPTPTAVSQPQAPLPQAATDWLVSFNHSAPSIQRGKTPEVTTPCYELNVPGQSSPVSFGCHHGTTTMHMPSSSAGHTALATTDSFVRMVHQRFDANPTKLSTFQMLLSKLQAHYCTQTYLLKQMYAALDGHANDDFFTQVATFLQLSCSHSTSSKQSTWLQHSSRCSHVMEGSDVVPLLPSTHAYVDQVVSTSLTKFFPRGVHDDSGAASESSTVNQQTTTSSDERVVKLGFQDHFHRIRVRTTNFALADLQQLFHTKVALAPGTFVIKYKDTDGDYVHVDTAADFHEAMQLAETMQRFQFDAFPIEATPPSPPAPERDEKPSTDDLALSAPSGSHTVEANVSVEVVDEAVPAPQDWRHAPEPDDTVEIDQPLITASGQELDEPVDIAPLTPEQALKWADQLAVVHEVLPSAKGHDVVRELEAANGNLQIVVNQLVDM